MTAENLKQYIALFGGWLSAILLFLGTLNIEFQWFTKETIDAFVIVLGASIPFVLVLYGVYKNTYKLSEKAKQQDETLKRARLK